MKVDLTGRTFAAFFGISKLHAFNVATGRRYRAEIT